MSSFMTRVVRSPDGGSRQGRHPGRLLGTVIACMAACLLVTSCTASTGGRESTAVSDGHSSAPPRAPKPQDRDLTAVTAALRAIDACALFDLAAFRVEYPGAVLQATGPHSCALATEPSRGYVDSGLTVKLGDSSNESFTYDGTPVVVEGAKGYEYRDYSGRDKRCYLFFPTSFTRAVKFTYQGENVDACEMLNRHVGTAVARLQNPDTVRLNPAAPFANWDGCTLLAQALGPDAAKYNFAPPAGGTDDPLSSCETSGQSNPRDYTAGPSLDVYYGKAITMYGETRLIGGKAAEVSGQTMRCYVKWYQAPSGTGDQWYDTLTFEITANSCDIAARLAQAAIPLVDQSPPDAGTPPHRPLLYRPDEPDVPRVGACVDFWFIGGRDACEPYHQVPVPEGIDAIVEADSNNPNISCAAFQDSIKAHFGAELQAATWNGMCFFLDHGQTLEIVADIHPIYQPGEYGTESSLWTEPEIVQFAGQPASMFWDLRKTGFNIYLSPFGDLNSQGFVHIGLRAGHGRGDMDVSSTQELDPAKAEAAKRVMAEVAQKYFAA